MAVREIFKRARRRQIVCRDTVVWQAAGQRRHAALVGVVVCDVEALTVSRIKLLKP